MKLQVAMKRRGLTEAETARRVGIAQSALNRINYSGKSPTLGTAAKIVSAFAGDVTYEDLLGPDARKEARKVRSKCAA